MIDRRRLLRLAGAGLAFPTVLQSAQAQGKYPDRSIRLVVPRVPGGAVDVIGRGWSEKVRQTLGPSHIENMGGGGGRIGATAAARAAPDGYTLLIGSTSELVLNPILETLPYDPIKDFSAIATLSTSPLIFAVDPGLPIHNLKELAAYVKANPGKANYGTAGAGTIGHVAVELFKQVAGLKEFVHVPYKGGAAAIAEVVGKRLTLGTVSISGAVVELHQAGKIRIVAVTSEGRSEALPSGPASTRSNPRALSAWCPSAPWSASSPCAAPSPGHRGRLPACCARWSNRSSTASCPATRRSPRGSPGSTSMRSWSWPGPCWTSALAPGPSCGRCWPSASPTTTRPP